MGRALTICVLEVVTLLLVGDGFRVPKVPDFECLT